jgi:hypothetical protein
MATMTCCTIGILGQYKCDGQGNDELAVQVTRANQQKPEKVLANIYDLGHERMREYSLLNTNSIVLQTIPMVHSFDFHRRTGGTWRVRRTCPDRPVRSKFCHRNDFALKQLDV